MDRTTAANYVTVGGLRMFQDANPGAGISVGTDLAAADQNGHQEEIMGVIEGYLGAGSGNAGNLKQMLAVLQAITGVHGQQFTASGTFTVPSAITAVEVEVWGAGGGAQGANSSTGSTGGGGGGYARKIISGLTPGATIAVTIGGGGAPGGSSTTAGSNGGTSSFGSYCSATGGQGGPVGNSAPAGIGVGGDVDAGGAGGNPAGSSAVSGSGGGGAMGGGGGSSGYAENGGAGGFPGGGGGASTTGLSAAGAGGLVLVRW